MASQTQTTTDHDEIRRWDEAHDGEPAYVRDTATRDDMGVLRIDFPGGADRTEAHQLVREFDASDVAILYQNEKSSGEDSTFFKLVQRVR